MPNDRGRFRRPSEFAGILRRSSHRPFTPPGCDTVLIGMVPTPVLYHTVFTSRRRRRHDHGLAQPADHNGFKICLGHRPFRFADSGNKRIALAGEYSRRKERSRPSMFLDEYCRDIVSRSMGGRKLKAVVDAGNGMGGVTAVPVYRAFGVELVELFTEPDSTFPNHHPDPTVTENLQDCIARSAKTRPISASPSTATATGSALSMKTGE